MNPPLNPLDDPSTPPAGSRRWDAAPAAAHLPGLTQAAELPPEPDDDDASPGQRLRRAREARRLEPGRVANELRLKPEVIRALEHDDYASMPGPLFAGGYLRSYARLLGLDPEPLLAEFRRLNPGAEAPPPRMSPTEEAEPGGGLLVPLFSALVVVALLTGVYLWWQHRELTPATVGTPADVPRTRVPVAAPRPAPVAPSAPAAAVTAPAPPPATSATVDQPSAGAPAPTDGPAVPTGAPAATTGEAVAPGAQPTAQAEVPAPAPTAPSSAPSDGAAAAPAAGEVALTFSGPSWVDVRDASGEFRLFGEMASGERKVLGGEPPYSLIIGNASAVEITVGTAPFDLNAVARGNVARFSLDPAALAADKPAEPQPAAD